MFLIFRGEIQVCSLAIGMAFDSLCQVNGFMMGCMSIVSPWPLVEGGCSCGIITEGDENECLARILFFFDKEIYLSLFLFPTTKPRIPLLQL